MPSPSPDASKRLGPNGPSVVSSRRNDASVVSLRESIDPRSAASGGRTTSIHPAHLRPTTGSMESVGSLLRRLGTPPPELASDLTQRFKRVCAAKLAGGEVCSMDLDQWFVDRDNGLIFLGACGANPDPTVSLESLVMEFQRQLSLPRLSPPRPAVSRRRHAPMVVQEGVDTARRFDMPVEDEMVADALSGEDQIRRDLVIQQFTAALTERFGQALMTPPPALEVKTRSVQPKPIEFHRRFNWNLVLGVATAAAFAAMFWTGYRLNEIRQQRTKLEPGSSVATLVAKSTRSDASGDRLSKSGPRAESTDLDAGTSDVPITLELGTTEVAPDELLDVAGSPHSAFVNNTPMLEDLFASLDLKPLTDAPSASVDGQADAEETGPAISVSILDDHSALNVFEFEKQRRRAHERLPEQPPLKSPPQGGRSTDEMNGNDILGPADQDAQSGQRIESELESETPQQTRASSIRFVDLTSAGKGGQDLLIASAAESLVRVEFPFPSQIVMTSSEIDGLAELRSVDSGKVLAQLRQHNRSTLFRWMTENAKDPAVDSMIHGRFVTQSGQAIYLRPSIEADPYLLSLDPKRSRPSWKLGAPLLNDVSRLELNLIVPDDIRLLWLTPYNATRPSGGSAAAVLSLADDENTAVVVMMDVNCSGKLSCHIQCRFQVDGVMANRSCSEIDLDSFILVNSNILESLQLRLAATGRKPTSLPDQVQWRNEREALEQMITSQQAKLDRLGSLKRLTQRIQAAVFLDPHLYVQWPTQQLSDVKWPTEQLPTVQIHQQRQTIFRPASTSPEPASVIP